MTMWLAILLGGFIAAAGASFAFRKRPRDIPGGEVSESWLREQRAEKRDQYP